MLEATPGPDADFSMSEISEAYMIPLEDYNQMEGSQETLEEGEVLVYDSRGRWEGDTLGIGGKTWKVRKEIGRPKAAESERSQTTQDVYLIFPDVQEITDVLTYVRENHTSGMDEEYLMSITQVEYVDSFDLSGSDETKAASGGRADQSGLRIPGLPGVECESRELSRESFYLLYGGIFFIGLYLGVMFLMATVLIIYYKQISEGYDDRERYQIMQKVGMDKREVRRSIRSQGAHRVLPAPFGGICPHRGGVQSDHKTADHFQYDKRAAVCGLHSYHRRGVRRVLRGGVCGDGAGVLPDCELIN